MSKKYAAKVKDDAKCRECLKGVSDKDKGIQCELCEAWHHLQCTIVSDELYKQLGAVDCLHWYCTACNKIVAAYIKGMKAMEARQDILEKKVNVIEEAMAKLEAGLEKMSGGMNEVKISVREVKELANGDEAILERKVNDKVKLVKEDLAEQIEIEKRKQNVVMWGLSENGTDEASCEGTKDTEAVKEVIMEGLNIDADRHVIQVQRIGKFVVGRTRPVRVKIQTLEGRAEIMVRAKALRDADKFKKVYISPDLTKNQQKVDKELRDKLKEIRKDNQYARIRQGKIVIRETNGKFKVLFSLDSTVTSESTVSKNEQNLSSLSMNK